jgi:hypothetical protein
MRARRTAKEILGVALVSSLGPVLPRIAQAEPESVRIDYSASAGCPDATAFLRSLQARTARFRQAEPDEQARRFLVRVLASGTVFSGRLEIQGKGGSPAVRSVEATICEEVTGALALMTALAIDPNARTGNLEPATESPVEPDAGRAATPHVRPAPAATLTVPATQTPSLPWRWSAGLQGHMTFNVSPALGYGGDLFVDAEAPGSSVLAPALRMGIFLNRSDVQLATGSAARFRWAAASVEGCPVRLGGPSSSFALHPCVAFRLGVLNGEGRRISRPKQTYNTWADLGFLLRLRIAATEHLVIEAQGQLMLPFNRPWYEIEDDVNPTVAYSVPRLGATAGMGIAYRFR